MLIKRTDIAKAFSLGVVLCLVQVSSLTALSAGAATPAAPMGDQAMSKEVGLIEDRFFAHQYANDPLEKRLERLELMVFGGTQEGSNEERYQRLKKLMMERTQAHAAKAAPTQGSSDADGTKKSSEKELANSSQYPVLNTLEWRALKKTYPSESLDQRLARMEQKLFGQDSPTMPYSDRVERLKRTLAIGVTAMQPSGPMGPAPKARPRTQMGDGTFGYSSPQITISPFGDDMNGGGMDLMPFGGGMFGSGISRSFSQMFQEMNKQMQELNRLGPGNWIYDQSTGTWTDQGTGRQIHPGQKSKPGLGAPAKPAPLPRKQQILPVQPHSDSEMPPYADPNSI